MNTLLTRRLLQLLPMLFFISLVAFLLVKLAPGDPVAAYITPRMAPEDIERIRQSLGLDKPLVTQYVLWLKNVLQGDLGYSLIYHRPVLEMIGERIPATLGLMGASLLMAIVLAIPLGLLAGAFKHRWLDHLLNLFAYIGISVPIFWFGILLTIKGHSKLTPILGIPYSYIDASIPVCCSFMLMYYGRMFWNSLRGRRNTTALDEDPEESPQ